MRALYVQASSSTDAMFKVSIVYVAQIGLSSEREQYTLI